jgi:hypothetical protein
MAPNAPLVESPHSVTCLTPGGASGASIHFRSPSGQMTGFFAELLRAVFGLLSPVP